ncbi:MAG: PIG-L family deacetylase [Flavobacterium sp.]|nr:PIG-L family deacetylase [Flavobacterium sp.]
MQKLHAILVFTTLLFINFVSAQQPQKPDAVAIYNQIQKLNFLGSVLYIAAHPDDENTRLISYLSNEKKARTAYLSLTRGDGGQNLIGPELRELLGVIRTQELIEARKIDGGEQFFSRANDFGYSKNPAETLQIWNKDEVLSDVVYIIRKFQPDVIINRFDARSPGTTHGHHTASAMLSLEAFDITHDPNKYPDQLKLVNVWQPKRVYFNTSWWFYGSKEKFEKADKSNLIQLKTGVYYQSVGKSNQEIAALSRSKHESQGFGSTGTGGEEQEYLELLKGDLSKDNSNIFEGIDTSWNRVKGGKIIGDLLQNVEGNFNFKNPSASIPDLVKAYAMIQQLEDEHWKNVKSEEIKKIIAGCAGLYLEAVSSTQEIVSNSIMKVKLEAINRSAINMQLASIKNAMSGEVVVKEIELKTNSNQSIDFEINLPSSINYTQPYWLAEQGTIGMYRVEQQVNIGKPDIIREVKLIFNIEIQGVSIPFEREVIYKYNDDVKGEVYKPLDIVPEVTTSIQSKVVLFNDNSPKTIDVKVKAGKDNVQGLVQIEIPENWKVTPNSISFNLSKKGEEQMVSFQIMPSKKASEIVAKCVAIVDSKRFDKEQFSINYEHICKQQVLKTSEAKLIKLDIKTNKEKIVYIMGAGDEVPKCLTQMGYSVTVLKPEDITTEKLKNFDVVMTGIRAYNTIQAMAFKQQMLFDFVKEGHNMIVQYNTLDDLVTKDIAPYALKISRDRVTDENAVVTFLEPKHPILNTPNSLTSEDFNGWKQEQGLYYPNEWDPAFVPIIAANDQGETSKKGAILVAKYGKGNYIYTGLSFFRELPEGVSGAYRLMANMISLPKN